MAKRNAWLDREELAIETVRAGVRATLYEMRDAPASLVRRAAKACGMSQGQYERAAAALVAGFVLRGERVELNTQRELELERERES